MSNASIDADFFAMVHRLIGPREDDPGTERRTNNRRPFRAVQWVAPSRPGQAPTARDFVEVECFDLSTSGIAYYADEPPSTPHLVFGLGTEGARFYVQAEVAHFRRVPTPTGPRFLVGCRFRGKLGA